MIDTTNTQMVTAHGGNVVVLNPRARMTPEGARVFAAWLVVMAEIADSDHEVRFEDYLAAVQNT
jgi:copper(I)-binding protein